MLRRGYMSADRAAAFSTYFEAALGAFFFFFSFFLRITFWRQSSPPPLGAASAMVFRARRKPTFALVSVDATGAHVCTLRHGAWRRLSAGTSTQKRAFSRKLQSSFPELVAHSCFC